MITYHKEELDTYLQNDWILGLLDLNMQSEEKEIRTNKWLYEMDNKRMIYADVYGDILRDEVGKETRVLDIGGGINALTKCLARNSRYSLLDFLAHGGKSYLNSFSDKYSINWMNKDWYEADIDEQDIVIANDIFPDADMRMELFLERMLPICRELRLVITYYNSPRFYQMGRADDPEVLTFLSWDGEITGLKLEKYLDRMVDTSKKDLDNLRNESESIYRNGRQVSYVRFRGDHA